MRTSYAGRRVYPLPEGADVKGILFDLDGVLYQGERPVPGAAQALAWVSERGIPHRFVTNTTSRPRQAIVDKLGDMGVVVSVPQILTPAVAASDWLQREAPGPVALFVPPATRAEFAAVPVIADESEVGAAALVVGDLGEGWDFVTLNRAFRLIMNGASRLLALGMTRYWQAPDGLRLDAGAYVAALRYATDLEPVVLGKPAAGFFRAALDQLGLRADEVIMIGDDIVGDVGGAQDAGLAGLLVRTGKYRDGDLDRGIVPRAILDSVAQLPAWWQRHAG